MPEIVVAAESRTETGKNANNRLRVRGLIPAVVYGSGKAPEQLAVNPKEIAAILRSGRGESTLFDLSIGGKARKVVLKEFQVEPVKGNLLHADFYEVDLKKAIHVKVHVELTGVPVGVKTEGGFLEWVTRELEVFCLPADIPEKFVVDVSEIHIGKHIRVAELKVDARIKILTDHDLVIAHVVGKREEEVPVVEAAAVPGAVEPEVLKKGKLEAEGEEKEAKKEKKEKK